jgi:spore cortex biosynthesis protein YabQ
VTNQAYIFLISIAGGLAAGLLFDFFRVLRRVIKTSNIITNIQDIIFWVLVTTMIFAIIFFNNDGELRWYEFLGTFIGVLLYSLVISDYFIKTTLAVMQFIIKISGIIFKPVFAIISRASLNIINKVKAYKKS